MTKGSNLVIVESPSKAKTIGKYLGPDYRVEACMGHLRDLPKSKMGVDLEHDFEPDYQPLASKAAIISELRSASKTAKHIYLATDPDREGEAISWHLKELLELPDRPTAVFVANDSLAIGCYKAVNEKGLAIPEDISVVGYNDIPAAKYLVPPLTTVHLYMDFMGEQAVSMLAERILTGREIAIQTLIPAKLVIRESVRKLNG